MKYSTLLLVFGIFPVVIIWLARPRLIRHYAASLLTIVVLILLVSIPWEMVAVNRIWYYSPKVLWGPGVFNLPVEELVFFVIDGLLVGTLALLLGGKVI